MVDLGGAERGMSAEKHVPTRGEGGTKGIESVPTTEEVGSTK